MQDPLVLRAPLLVLADIISRCQLRCSYCSAMPFSGNKIDTDLFVAIIHQLVELRVPNLTISGGEPCLHNDLPAFLDTAVSGGLTVCVNTNGLQLSCAKFLDRLRPLAGRFTFSISLDSIRPEINDLLRGQTQRVLNGIIEATKAGHLLYINVVVSRDNLAYLVEIVDYLFPMVKKFGFFRCYPTWQQGLSGAGLVLSDNQYNKAVAPLMGAMDCARWPGAELSVQYKTIQASMGQRIEGEGFCLCPYTKLYITEDLKVYPCSLSRHPAFYLGSLKYRRVLEVWNSSAARRLRSEYRQGHPCGVTFSENRLPTRYGCEIGQAQQ